MCTILRFMNLLFAIVQLFVTHRDFFVLFIWANDLNLRKQNNMLIIIIPCTIETK